MVEHLPYTNSCFVCGFKNPHGLNLRFTADADAVRTEFAPRTDHAGYPGLLHGGAIGAVLDEAMFWAATHGQQRMHLSAEVTVRYRQKVHVGQTYRVVARIAKSSRAVCATEAELIDDQDNVCATATGKYLPLPPEDAALVLQDFHPDEGTVPLDRYFESTN